MLADWEAIRRRGPIEAGAAANYPEARPASHRQLRTTAAALPALGPPVRRFAVLAIFPAVTHNTATRSSGGPDERRESAGCRRSVDPFVAVSRSMRILLTSHEPLDVPGSGELVDQWTRGLTAAGHQVRVLAIDGVPTDDAEPNVRRIFCHATDRRAPLPFVRPTFAPTSDFGLNFTALTDRQLSDYRDLLRVELDREIDLYDPCIVHVQHVWLFGHLALEAGVPYVVSAHGEEFELARRDWRFRRYMQETAENACRILAHGEAAQIGVAQLVGDLEGRVVPQADARTAAHTSLPQLYREALVDRFGRLPPHCER